MPDRENPWPPQRPNGDPLADIRRLWVDIRRQLSDGEGSRRRGGPGPGIFAAIALLLWVASGIYIVAPDQRGVVLRFGRVVGETGPGPHYHLPWPIEQVLRPSVTAIRKEEIGFRTIDVGPPARYRDVAAEALMLTGDENIVKLDFIVQYKVRPDTEGTADFLFNVRDREAALRAAAEAAMREVVGRTEIDQVLTEGKEVVQTQAQEVLQAILDRYDVGLEVVTVKLQDVDPPEQVSDAFKDVISAQQDRERLINEAHGYENDVVPRARGQAAQILNEAEGYAAAKVREATGAAQRFVALQEEYAKAKEVTRRRLYLETMEDILPGMNKIVMDDLAARQAVPYLPLEPFLPRRTETAPQSPAPRAAEGR
jgi:membrane protease subunit HflK